MSSISSAIFSGQSSFSADFQSVLTRAVAIASLPMQAMQNDVSKLQAQQQALYGLSSKFINLSAAVSAVAVAAKGSLTSTSTQPQAVSASTTSDALAGTYSLEVVSTGSATTTMSKAGLTTVTDPSSTAISSATSFTLTVNGTEHTITPSGTSLVSLASALNDSGAGVHATVVNVGANGSPDYRLAITGDTLGSDDIQLSDGSQDLLDTLSSGSKATYKVNGGSTILESTSNEITLAPGLTVRMLQATTSGAATITVNNDTSSLKSALSSLATAYNAAFDALSAQRGVNAGVLRGQSTISSLTHVLQSMSQFSGGSGSINNLSEMGMSLDRSGHLSFDSTSVTKDTIDGIQQFLGTTATSGFLKAATDSLNSVSDNDTGIIQTETVSLVAHVSLLNNQIALAQTRVDNLQTNLMARLTEADAAIATLQAQKSYFQNLFAATYLNNSNNSSSS